VLQTLAISLIAWGLVVTGLTTAGLAGTVGTIMTRGVEVTAVVIVNLIVVVTIRCILSDQDPDFAPPSTYKRFTSMTHFSTKTHSIPSKLKIENNECTSLLLF
jgi:hypothetical protein